MREAYQIKIKILMIIAITIVILIGSGLRFYNLEQRGLWYDELYSVGLANMVGKNNTNFFPEFKHPNSLTIEDNFWTWKLTDPHPPLYDAFLSVWVKIAGTSDFAVRIPSVLFGIILLIYSVLGLRKLLPLETLFYYITWLSLSLILIRYAQEARPYSLTALSAGMLTIEFARHFFRNPHNFAPISWQFIFIALLLSYSHFYGLLLAGIFCLWVIINVLWQRQFKELIKFIVIIIGVAPLLIFAIYVKRYLVTLKPLDQIFNFDKIFFVSLSQSFENVLPYLGFVGILIIITGLFYIIKNRTESINIHLGLTLFVITLLFVLFMSVGMQKKAAWLDRYFISIIPVLTLSLSIFLSEIPISKKFKSSFLISLLIFPLYKHGGINYQINEQYREASQFISQQITDKDVLLMIHKPNLMMFLHYLQIFSKPKLDNNIIVFNEDDALPATCQNVRNRLHINSKLFIFYHVTHEKVVKQFSEMCQLLKYNIEEKPFYYVNVTIFTHT